MSVAKIQNWAVPKRRTLAFAFTLLALVSVLPYSNCFLNDFVFDDTRVILRNPLLKQLDQIPTLFATGGWMVDETGALKGHVYRPLVLSSFAVNYGLSGYGPFGYHLLNVVLHILVTWALFCLARRLGFSFGAALVATSLFAVHPLHVEAVTGIVGRAELMMALGVLMALVWYIDGGAPVRLTIRYGLASLVAFIIALLSKEQAMMLPALLVFYDLSAWDNRTSWKRRVWNGMRRYVWYLLTLFSYLVIRAIILADQKDWPVVPFLDNPLAHQEWPSRLFSALAVSGNYLWLFIWPEKLSADYSYNAIPLATGPWEAGVVISSFAWCALLGVALWSYFKGSRKAFFSVGLTFVMFLPTSNFLISIGTIMGERLFYLPSAGLCLLLGACWDWPRVRRLFHRYPVSRAIGIGIFAALLLLLSLRTFYRNEDWRSNETLFHRAIEVVPNSAKARAGLAGSQLRKNEFEQALENYEAAMRIYPDYPLYYPRFALNIGSTLISLGRVSAGIPYLKKAVELKPDFAVAQYNLGFAYLLQGSWKESEKAFGEAVRFNPDYVIAHIGLSKSLRQQQRFRKALDAADNAIRLRPDSIAARIERAASLEALGYINDALREYEKLLELKPAPELQSKRLELKRRVNEEGRAN